jgi:hypothetical protein
LDFDGICIVFYFGTDDEVHIPDRIETIGLYSFNSKRFLRSVSFGRESNLRSFGPSSFGHCAALNVIHIPSSVRAIGSATFFNCRQLKCVTFESISELAVIGNRAFLFCPSLQSLCLPASIESIGKSCLLGCTALSTLVFECPSRLRELRSFPTSAIRSLDIPDSVEVLQAQLDTNSEMFTLNFGEGSQLGRLSLMWAPQLGHLSGWVRVFVRLPAHRLKVFRCNQEFV